MESTPIVIEAQLDWLTCAVHTQEKRDRWYIRAERWAKQEREQGNKLLPFRLNGYQGWRCGRVRWGTRESAGLFQLSGEFAAQMFDILHRDSDSITRLDVAVTVQLSHSEPLLGITAFAQACGFRDAHPNAARPRIVEDADGGCTCYVGDRSSDFFFRLYNKEQECVETHDEEGAVRYRNCWRYELECKGVNAATVAAGAAAAGDRNAWAQGLVHNYVSAHGITPLFPYDGDRVLRPGFRRRSDATTRLDWLARSVAPALRWLEDMGYGEDARKQLGLD